MTGIDGSEIFLLLLIGIVILGPKRLPEVANKIGGWVGQARRMTRVMKRQLEEELDMEEFKLKPLDKHTPRNDDTYSPVHAAEAAEPKVGGMAVKANVPASEVVMPEDDDSDTVAPPAGEPAAKKTADDRSA